MPGTRCIVCRKLFYSDNIRQITCSPSCRKKRNTAKTLESYNIKKKHPSRFCEICGFSLTTDIHHENKILHILCPTHHALITRHIRSFSQLIEERDSIATLEHNYNLTFRNKSYPWLTRKPSKAERENYVWDPDYPTPVK
jgi:hypothetical protein